MSGRMIAILAAVPLAFAAPALAIDNIEIMAPGAPGGGYDRTARAIQETIEKEGLGKGVSVTNVPGAGGAIGLAQFIRTKSGRGDALIVGGLDMVASLASNKPVEGAKVTLADVTPLARLTAEFNIVVVPAKSPIKSIKGLIAAIKKDPRAVSWGGVSVGDNMLAASIMKSAGIDPLQTRFITVAGGGDLPSSIIGGQVTVGVGGYSELIEPVKAGNLRALGVAAIDRVEGIDMPTLREQGIDVTFSHWRGVAGPPKISKDQREAYLTLIEKVTASSSWKGHLKKNGWVSAYLAGDAFAAHIVEETERVTLLLGSLGLMK